MLISQSLVAYITAVINHVFISFSAVQIYGLRRKLFSVDPPANHEVTIKKTTTETKKVSRFA